ncbi:MAG: FAD-dependent oxidoreductase [Nitrospinales bacterium]
MGKKTIILGAGAAGLAAAWRLSKNGGEAHVIEMSGRLGGLAGGVELNGNIYEYGPHLFHTTDQEILNDIKMITGNDLIIFNRTVKIKFMGEYFNFPLAITDVLTKLPFETVVKSFFSLIYHTVKTRFIKPETETSETVLLGNYGRVLYEIFFKSYIEQVWGYPPKQFSPDFAKQRIPRINILEVMEKIFKQFKKSKSGELNTNQYVEKIEGEIFTTRRGFSMIADRIGEEIKKHGGRIYLNTKATEIVHSRQKVNHIRVATGDIEEIMECDHLISTIPLNNLTRLMQPPPAQEITDAASALKFRATLFVGMVINRTKVLPASFMYFREISFNRIMDLGYFGIDIKPGNATILIAEVNCETSDFIWIEESHAKKMVIKDLVNEKLITEEEILECHVFKAPHAYPMYLLGYERNLRTIFDWVDNSSNLQTIGRQGRFQYVNSHVAMKMGYIAADKILHSDI